MSSELPNLWIRENTLSLPRAKRAMRRVGESPVRVLETNIDLPLSVNGDLNKGPNGNNRGAVHDHHHHHHDHEAEAAAPTDTMLAHHHHVKYPLPNDDDDDDDIKGKPGKLQKMAHRHGLTKKGLLLLLLVGFLCVVQLVALLVMTVLWPKDLEQLKTEVCLTPDCLRASAQPVTTGGQQFTPAGRDKTIPGRNWLRKVATLGTSMLVTAISGWVQYSSNGRRGKRGRKNRRGRRKWIE
ncbi:uncharacterized protein LOC135101948 isoform X1 [Scylla paramamosain]|uniref:uncharacterized protein LOC135101948 isoform X1 n=1 Tax=Scylla paramamosain TaxID=85552 RepID=UPI00308347B9